MKGGVMKDGSGQSATGAIFRSGYSCFSKKGVERGYFGGTQKAGVLSKTGDGAEEQGFS